MQGVCFQGAEEKRVKILSTVKQGHDVRYITLSTSKFLCVNPGTYAGQLGLT